MNEYKQTDKMKKEEEEEEEEEEHSHMNTNSFYPEFQSS